MSVYRKSALERISSPDQLDQLMKVSKPSHWIALMAFGLILTSALVWSFVGAIPTEATGKGILLRQGGVTEVMATASGQIEQLLVEVGMEVKSGQQVAVILQEDLDRRIGDLRHRRLAREREQRDLEADIADQWRLALRQRLQKRSDLEQTVQTLEREIALLEEKSGGERRLIAEGVLTRQAGLATEQILNSTRDRLAAARLALGGLELEQAEQRERFDRTLEAKAREVRDLELDLERLIADHGERVRVEAPIAGRVVELRADRGEVVQPGAPILSIESLSSEIVAVIFVPADSAKAIRPGMPVRVALKSVKPEEHGFIVGTVRWAAEFPSTSRGLERLLGNIDLVIKLMDGGPPIRVEVVLERDPLAPSGFRWSSGRGPDLIVSSGALIEGAVIVDRDRPIDLLIPRLRKSLGLGA